MKLRGYRAIKTLFAYTAIAPCSCPAAGSIAVSHATVKPLGNAHPNSPSPFPSGIAPKFIDIP